MKKSFISFSTLALFAGAAMAAEEPTSKILSIENQDSFTVNSDEYVQATGYYWNTTGEQHRGPVYNVGEMSINGIFESYVQASAQALLGAKKVSGDGELRIRSALFVDNNTDMSGFTGKVNGQYGILWFTKPQNNPSNISEFSLSDSFSLRFTSGDYTLNGAIKGSGAIKSIKYPDNQIENGVYIIKDATPANVTIKGDISQFNGHYVADANSKIKLETKLADSVLFKGTTGGTLELIGAEGDARKTITVASKSTWTDVKEGDAYVQRESTTTGNVFMYGNKAIIESNSNDAGTLGVNGGTIYFGGNHAYTQKDRVSYKFDKTTVLGNTAGNVVVGGKGAGSVMENGANITITDNIKANSIVIGAADGATVEGNTYVKMESGELDGLYGGMGGIHNGSTTMDVSGGSVKRLYGGDYNGGTVNGSIYIHVKDANVEQLYGSNYHYDSSMESKFGGVKGNVSIIVDGEAKVGQIRGGINTTAQESEAIAKEKMVLDGSVSVTVKGNAVVGDGKVAILGAGGSYGSVREHTNISISENATVNGDIFAGANSVGNDSSANLPYVGTSTWLKVDDNATINGNLFGGSRRNGVVNNNTNVSVNGGTVNGSVYGAGQVGSAVEGMSIVSIGTVPSTNPEVPTVVKDAIVKGDVFGGGKNGGAVSKQTYIKIYDGATIEGNVYGGGENGNVNGTSQLEIYGGTINGDIYGGGKDGGTTNNSSVRFVSNNDFSGVVNGGGANGATVKGQRRLTFGGWGNGEKWDGDFKGKIENINSVVLTNGSNVSNLRFDMAEPMSFGGLGTLEVVTNLVGRNIDSTYLVNVLGSSPLDITFRDSTFSGNTINNNSYGVFLHWGAGKMAFDGTTIENSTITRSDGKDIQGILYYNGSGSGEVVNTVLKNNTVSAVQVKSSGVFAYKQNLDISGSQFIGNKSIGSNAVGDLTSDGVVIGQSDLLTSGVVYVENQSDVVKTVNISDTLFYGNSAENTADASMGRGGALAVVKRAKFATKETVDANGKTKKIPVYDDNGNLVFETKGAGANVVLNDATFTNNSAGMGGAIYVGGETLTLNATKSATFSGNTASKGGFLYMDNGEKHSTASAKVAFNVYDNATLAIGVDGGSSDSIEGIESAVITKLGAGSLNVSGSMASFKGSLIVSAGVMNVNNGLGASSVSIANSATLGVALGNGALESSSIVNNGTLSLKRGSLSDGSAFTLSNYSGEGLVNAYGGSMSGNTFTAGKSAEAGVSAKVGSDLLNDVQSVSFKQDGKELLNLDFDVSKMGDKKLSVVSVDAVDASQKGNIDGDFLGGYAVSVDNADGAEFGVVFSAYIGEVEEPSNIIAWHRANGSDIWEKLETTVEYKDGVASIMVNGFSAYAFSIPEPSTYAVVLGMFAMALAAYRRSKK